MSFMRLFRSGPTPPSGAVQTAHAEARAWIAEVLDGWFVFGDFPDHDRVPTFAAYAVHWEELRREVAPKTDFFDFMSGSLLDGDAAFWPWRDVAWMLSTVVFGSDAERSALPQEQVERIARRVRHFNDKVIVGDRRLALGRLFTTPTFTGPAQQARRRANTQAMEAERADLALARARFGSVPVIDWPEFNRTVVQGDWSGLEKIETKPPRVMDWLCAATPDIRHVALRVGFNQDEYETRKILDIPDCDRATALHLYAGSLAASLNTYFASHLHENATARFVEQAIEETPKNGPTIRHVALAAHISQRLSDGAFARRELAFDLGALLPKYERMERLLVERNLRPAWLLPADDLRPQEGRQAACRYAFFDWTIFRLPDDLPVPPPA